MNKYLKAIEIINNKTDELVECIEDTLIERLRTKANRCWIGGYEICVDIETEEFEAVQFQEWECNENLVTLLVIDDDFADLGDELNYFRDALYDLGIEFDERLTDRQLEELFADDYAEFVDCLIADVIRNLDAELYIIPDIIEQLEEEASLYD